MARELLFSVTAADCGWDYFKSSGPGGQNVNKRNTGVRCTHPPSGAVGQATDHRTQEQNKKLAFKRMHESAEFKKWHRLEVARRTGALVEAENRVEEAMQPENLKIEVKDEKGRWTGE